MRIPWAEVEIGALADMPPRLLRLMLCPALERVIPGGAHVDWHGHAAEGTRATAPPICYRAGGRVYLCGPRTRERMGELLLLGAVTAPDGRVIEIPSMEVRFGEADVGASPKSWRAYDLVTPYWPSTVAQARRRGAPPAAWASMAIRNSLCLLLEEWGVDGDPYVVLEGYREIACAWERPARGVRDEVRGVIGRVVTTASLPDGIGIGQHRAEGFGELRRVG